MIVARMNRTPTIQAQQHLCEKTPVVEISGITGYRLLGLLLAIAGLAKTVSSVKGLSGPVNKMDLVITGVFGIMYDRIMDPCIEFTY
jgi:hypothetical protein